MDSSWIIRNHLIYQWNSDSAVAIMYGEKKYLTGGYY